MFRYIIVCSFELYSRELGNRYRWKNFIYSIRTHLTHTSACAMLRFFVYFFFHFILTTIKLYTHVYIYTLYCVQCTSVVQRFRLSIRHAISLSPTSRFHITFIYLLLLRLLLLFFFCFYYCFVERRTGSGLYPFLVSNPFSTCHSDFPTDKNTSCHLFIIMLIYYIGNVGGRFIFSFLCL